MWRFEGGTGVAARDFGAEADGFVAGLGRCSEVDGAFLAGMRRGAPQRSMRLGHSRRNLCIGGIGGWGLLVSNDASNGTKAEGS